MYNGIVIPRYTRARLKKPLGKIIEAVPLLPSSSIIVTIGDVVTGKFLEQGIIPQLAIIDHRTRRRLIAKHTRVSAKLFEKHILLNNYPGTISIAVMNFIRAYNFKIGSTLLEIDGEEDLLALPVCQFAPLGTNIFYGQPNRGIVHIRVNSAFRSRMRRLSV